MSTTFEGWKTASVALRTRIVLIRVPARSGAPFLATVVRSVREIATGCAVIGLLALAGCAAPVAVTPSPPAQPPVLVPTKKPLKIGLALGGGAARGFAHVGVIAVLEEAGL